MKAGAWIDAILVLIEVEPRMSAETATTLQWQHLPLLHRPNDPFFGGFPNLTSMNFPFPLGGPASWPKSVGPDSVYQFNDSLSWQKGKHAIKFGGEVLLNRSDDNVTSNNKGPTRSKNLDAFFTGTRTRRENHQRRHRSQFE